MKIIQSSGSRAFTLIELLVVMSIIAGLAALALPAIGIGQQQLAKIKDINNLKQIGIGCKAYATDFDGDFPKGLDGSGNPLKTEPANANIAYRELFQRGIFKEERVFYSPGTPGAVKPDGDIGEPDMYNQALEKGENSYIYVWGQRDSSEPNDLLAGNPTVSGFQPTEKGWSVNEFHPRIHKGNGIVVLRVDGGAEFVQKRPGNETIVSTTKRRNSEGRVLGPDL